MLNTKARFKLPHEVPLSPFFILLLPSLLVVIYGFDQMDWPRLKYYLIWAVLFSSLSLMLGRAVLVLLAMVFIPLGVVEIFHLFIIKALISQASMYVIFETNLEEAVDYLGMSFSWAGLVVSIAYVSCSIWLLKSEWPGLGWCRWPRWGSKAALISGGLLAVVASYAVQGKVVKILPPTISSAIRYAQEIEAYKAVTSQTRFRFEKLRTLPLPDEQSSAHVVVIGESTNRNHMSLYGYPRDTNPLLSQQSDELLIYRDVISPYSHTLPVLRTALTLLRQNSKLEFYQAHSLIDFARAAGFEVSWLSNQLPIGAWDNMISVMGHTADNSLFVNLADSSERVSYTASYDEKLFTSLATTLADQSQKNKVILMHLMGTHGAYYKRYPPEFAVFSEADDRKQQIINEYDNAVRYNDYVIHSIIQQLKQHATANPDAIVSMTYFSDHGEEVYDSQDFIGHDWNRLSRHHVEIPFIVWVSDSFKHRYPDKYAQMQTNIDTAYMMDDYIQSFLDLAAIQTAHFIPEQSLFSKKLRTRIRTVYKVNYDIELRQSKPKTE